MEFLFANGPLGAINTIILAVIIVIGLRNAHRLYVKKEHGDLVRLGRSINAMLFGGAIIVLLGLIGPLVGFQLSVGSLFQMSSDPDFRLTALLMRIALGLNSVIFSLVSFTVIAIVWFVFTGRHRKLLERSVHV